MLVARPIAFLAFLAPLAMLVLAGKNDKFDNPVDIYTLQTHGDIIKFYNAADKPFNILPHPTFSLEGFDERALKQAEGGAAIVHEPDPKLYTKSAHGRKGAGKNDIWFYSVVRPDSPLGQELRLKNDEALSLLWWHRGGRSKMMHMDKFEWHSDLDWSHMTELKNILRLRP